jgi:cell division protein FtsB
MSARATDIKPRTKAGRPDLRVVRKRRSRSLIKRTNARRISVYVAGGIFAAAIVAAVLLEQVVLAQSAFHLSDLRRDLQVAEEKQEELLLEAAQLDSSARIERYARENLGMVDPLPGGVQYIVADIKQPKKLRDGLGGKRRSTVPTEGLATGDLYGSGGTP